VTSSREGKETKKKRKKERKKEACILCSVSLLCSASARPFFLSGLVLKRLPPQSPQSERIDPPNPTAKLVIFSPSAFLFRTHGDPTALDPILLLACCCRVMATTTHGART
jgi:hypothetical protein